MAKSGDCVIKHTGTFATGLSMVVSGHLLVFITLVSHHWSHCPRRVLFVTSVKRGCVMDASVSPPTHAPVHSAMQTVLSVGGECGTTVSCVRPHGCQQE